MAFADEGSRGGSSQKPMFEGNWTCGSCNGKITKLPFKPDESRPNKNLKCLDCWKKSRPQRDNRF